LIPEKFIKHQEQYTNAKKWLISYYYPMINSIEGQIKMIKRNPNVIKELDKLGILLINPIDVKDILKQTEWS